MKPIIKTVLCFGNEYIKEDALAKEIADELKIENVRFVKCDDLNQILDYKNENLFILDVAEGISKIEIIKDIDKIKTKNITSLHDFDLGYFLKLMKEIGKLKAINIIAIPIGMDKEKAKKELKSIFQKI